MTAGAEHELADGFAGIFSFIEDQFHLFGDRHFDAMAAGEAERGARGEDTFSDFSTEALKDFRELAALSEGFTDGAVTAEGAGAGENEVADAGEAGESVTLAAAGYGEAGDFRDAAGDKGGGGVVAEADPGGDTSGDGDDVFERPPEFDADDVGGGVEAEGVGGEFLLDEGSDFGVLEGDGDGGGLGVGDFKGEAGSAEGTNGEVEILKGERGRGHAGGADFEGGVVGKGVGVSFEDGLALLGKVLAGG